MLAEELEPRTLLAAEIWLAPEVDAIVSSASPNEYAGDAFLVVSSSLWKTREAYLRFDLALVPADFNSARLRLTTERVTGLAVENQLAFVGDNTWTTTGPGAINWTNKPAAVANAYLPSPDTWAVDHPMTVELDLTELVEWSVTRGDLDADGDVDFDDISAFVVALTNPAQYESQYGQSALPRGDVDGSGQLDFDDIDPLIAILAGGDGTRAVSLLLRTTTTDRSESELVVYGSRVSTESKSPDLVLGVPSLDPPTAADDLFSVAEDTMTTLDVLANDTTAAGAGTELEVWKAMTSARGGSVWVSVDRQTVRYHPPSNFVGVDTFTYRIRAANGTTDTATATVTVTNTNDLPVAWFDAYAVNQEGSNYLLDVLANDTTTPDVGETLTITNVDTRWTDGTVEIVNGGTGLSYSPPPDFSGLERFSYQIDDGNGGTAEANVEVTVDETRVLVDLITTDTAGNPISSVPVGDDFLLQAYVEDPRGLAATGVFSAYLDVVLSDAALATVAVGETQTLTLSANTTGGSYSLALDGQTTGPIELGSSIAAATANLQQALDALPNLGPGNVRVLSTPLWDPDDLLVTLNPLVFALRFTGDRAGQDVPELTVDPAGLTSADGVPPTAGVVETFPADAANPRAFRSAFVPGPAYPNALLAASEPGRFAGVGAAGSSNPLGGGQFLLFQVPLKAVAAGQLALAGTPPGDPDLTTTLYGLNEALSPGAMLYSGTTIDIVDPASPAAAATAPASSLSAAFGVAAAAASSPGSSPWQNPRWREDVNDNGYLSPLDALLIINEVNRHNDAREPVSPADHPAPPYLDVNGDGTITPLDILIIFNFINTYGTVVPSFPPTAGDFDGDGLPEVVTLDLQNESSRWQIFDRAGAAPFEGGHEPWDQVVVGDWNGDGRDDIAGYGRVVLSRPDRWRAMVSHGTDFSDLRDVGFAATPAVYVGDFNGDGRDDLAGQDASTGAWTVALSTGTEFRQEAWGSWDAGTTWDNIRALDLNGDGRDDLIGQAAAGGPAAGSWQTAISTGTAFLSASQPATTSWPAPLTGDFDGDGAAELVARNTGTGRWQRLRYTGETLQLDSDWGAAPAAIPEVTVADLNRDGRDDLLGKAPAGWQVALSDGTQLLPQDWGTWYDPWSFNAAGIDVINPDEPLAAAIDAFEAVYNNVELQFYPGFMKGPQATEETAAANPWEQAALLVDKLEQLGLAADIVSGDVRAPADEVMAWVGAKSTVAAAEMVVASFDANAAFVGNDIQFRHAWVRAYLPGPDGLAWRDLDPSWKFKDYQPGVANILEDVPFDFRGYLRPPRGTGGNPIPDAAGTPLKARRQLPYEYYEDQVSAFLAQNLATRGLSLADVPYDGPIIQKSFDTLPPPPGYAVVGGVPLATYDNFQAIAQDPATALALTHRVELTLRTSSENFPSSLLWTVQRVVPEIALDRITIADSQLGGAFGSRTVNPELRINGVLQTPGNIELITTSYVELTVQQVVPGTDFVADSEPADDPTDRSRKTTQYTFQPYQYTAVGLDALQFSAQHLDRMREEMHAGLAAINDSEPADPGEAVVGRTLAYALAKYWYDFGIQGDLMSGLTEAVGLRRRVGSGIAQSTPTLFYDPFYDPLPVGQRRVSVDYFWDLQLPAVPRGLMVDLKNWAYRPLSQYGLAPENEARTRLIFSNASALEHAIVEEVANAKSASTVKGLQLAQANGVLIFVLQKSSGTYNVELLTGQSVGNYTATGLALMLQLSAKAESDIIRLLNRGFTITVPEQETRLADLPLWQGSVYIAEKFTGPSAGTSYVISGGFNGGYLGAPPIERSLVPTDNYLQTTYASDPVNVANGSMFRDEADIDLPRIGLPLQFARHYDSLAQDDSGAAPAPNLGAGWKHTFGDYLSINNSNVIWYTSTGQVHTFDKLGSTFTVPPSLHGQFTFDGSTYTYRDKNGTQTTFDDSGRLKEISDRNGNGFTVTHGTTSIESIEDKVTGTTLLAFTVSGGTITQVQDFTGRKWIYRYTTIGDAKYLASVEGPITAEDDRQAVTVRYQYYSTGQLKGLVKKIVEPDGGERLYEYYPNRRAFRVTDPEGFQQSFSYNLFRNQTTFRAEANGATTYQYDNDGLTLREIQPDRARDVYTWDDDQRVMTSWTNATGDVETYDYYPDGLGNLRSTAARDGQVTSFEYEPAFNQVTKITVNPSLAAPEVTEFWYDAKGNRTGAKDAQGNVTTATYDSRGLVETRTAAKGNVAQPDGNYTTELTDYNAAGQVKTITTGLPSMVQNTYDSRGNLTETIDPTGRATHYQYDLLGRRIEQRTADPDGPEGPLGDLVTTFTYNDAGDLETVTDPRGLTTTYVYDRNGNLVETRRADSTFVAFQYDGAGNRTAMRDARGYTAEYVHDARGRVVQTLLPDGTSTRARYDGQGRVVASTDERGNATTFTYDPAGRLLTTTDPLQNTTVNRYDEFGNLTSVTDRRGYVTTFRYDSLNRPTETRAHKGGFFFFNGDFNNSGGYYWIATTDYDANGNVIASTRYALDDTTTIPADPRDLPASLQRTVATRYDVLDRPVETIDPFDQSNSTYYDDAGRVERTVDEAQRETLFLYDGAGRLIGQRLRSEPLTVPGPVAYFETAYELDAAGNWIKVTDAGGRPTAQAYDALDRLVQTIDAEGGVAQTLYDAGGLMVGSIDPLGRSTTLVYDARGRLAAEYLPVPNGTGSQGPINKFAYDDAGNRISETDPLGRVTTYQYDELGRLETKTLPNPFGQSAFDTLGTWTDNGNGGQAFRGDRLLAPAGDGSRVAIWTFDDLPAGQYQVSATWQPHSVYRATDAPYRIYDGDTFLREVRKNQLNGSKGGDIANPDVLVDGQRFMHLGAPVAVTSGTLVVTLANDANEKVSADAIRIQRTGGPPLVRIIDDRDPTAPSVTYGYDAEGNLESQTDALGRVTTFTYDDVGRIETTILPDPDGDNGPLPAPSTTNKYDALGNLRQVTDHLGRVTTYEYDRLNRLQQETLPDPDGDNGPKAPPVTSFTYDAAGNVETITRDPNGLNIVTGKLYNVYDLVKQETQDYGGRRPFTTEYTYDEVGNLATVRDTTDIRDITTRYIYDGLNRRTHEIRDDSGLAAATTLLTYDAAGNLTATTNAKGQRTTYVYDNLDRRVRQTLPDPDGPVIPNPLPPGQVQGGPLEAPETTFTYDLAGNLLSQTTVAVDDTLASDETTVYTYDGLDRRITTTAANGDATYFDYDLAGNLYSVTDGQDNTTVTIVDDLDRPIREINAQDKARVTTYDAAGNLQSNTDRNGQARQFAYDNLDRVAEERWLGASPEQVFVWDYDEIGRLASLGDGLVQYAYQYDNRDRITSLAGTYATSVPAVQFALNYDDTAGQWSRAEQIGGQATATNTYWLDRLERIGRITQTAGGGRRVDFQYDAVGNVKSIQRYAGVAGNDQVTTSSYQYDLAGRLSGLQHESPSVGGTLLASYGYTYDAASRARRIDSTDGQTDFQYDLAGQISAASYSFQPAANESYTYDANGNRAGGAYVVEANNELAEDASYTYQYDNEGNLTKRTRKGTSPAETVQYTWDYRNRLTEVLFKTGAARQKRIVYTYDPNDLRSSRTVYGSSDQTVLAEEHYVYDENGAVALVFDGAGNRTHRYLQGPAVDQVLADQNALDNILWPLADHQGTVRDLARYDETTRTTSVVNHITYDSFGNITSQTDSSVEPVFAFTGREWDAEAELYYYRARWYDPQTGRFLSQDPISFAAGDANLYRYAGNDPVNQTDPSGLKVKRPTAGLSGLPSSRGNAGLWAQPLPDLGINPTNPWSSIDALVSPRSSSGGFASSLNSVPASLLERPGPRLDITSSEMLVDRWGTNITRTTFADGTVLLSDQSFRSGTINPRGVFVPRGMRTAETTDVTAQLNAQVAVVGSMILGVGEIADLKLFFGAGVSSQDRINAGRSLLFSGVTVGTSPNYGTLKAAADDLAEAAIRRNVSTLPVAARETTALITHPFGNGGTHVTTTSRLEFYKARGSTTYGNPSSGLFLAPKSQIDDLLARGASRREIEIALGLNENALQGGRLLRIDVDNPFARGLRLPEGGNIHHRPGTGLTLGNFNEGAIDAPTIGTRGIRKTIIRGH